MAKEKARRKVGREACDERIDALRAYRHDQVNFHNPGDYISVCHEASHLLDLMGEDDVSPEELATNGKEIRRFIVSLQKLANMASGVDYRSDATKKEIIEIFYEESQRHVGEVEAELSYFVRTHRR